MKSCDQLSDHPVVQKVDRKAESNPNSGWPDFSSLSMVVSNLFKLFPVEEGNPDHGEWDTYVM